MSNFPHYQTVLFTDVYGEVNDFIYDYNNVGIPKTISVENCMTLYYLLYARYGNSPIANWDVTQFKYKVFSTIFQYGPVWEKKLSVQEALRSLNISDLIDNGAIHDLFTHDGSNSGTLDSTVTTDQDTTNTGTQTNVRSGSQTDAHTGTIGNSGSDTYNNYATAKTGQDIHNHAFNPETAVTGTTELGYINEQNVDKFNDTTTTTGSIAHANTQTNNNTDTTTFNNVQDQRTDNLAGTNDIEVTTGQSTSGTDSSEDENTKTITRGKLEGYEKLLELLEDNFTKDFLDKFKYIFKLFVTPVRPYIYVSEDYEDEGE